MLCVTVREPFALAVLEDPDGALGPDDVLIRGGICGSDIHTLHSSNPFARYPLVIGHEFAGTIEALGSGELDNLNPSGVTDGAGLPALLEEVCRVASPGWRIGLLGFRRRPAMSANRKSSRRKSRSSAPGCPNASSRQGLAGVEAACSNLR